MTFGYLDQNFILMIKNLLLLPALLLGLFVAQAQEDCDGTRYSDQASFQTLVTPSILFGASDIVFDSIVTPVKLPLFMDVYQPIEIGAAPRPVIVMAFGGAYVYGARVSPDIVQICNRYAQMGYVMVSIDYRLSDELLINPSPENATRAVLKGTQDFKAAVRYIRRSVAELGNIFNIDTNRIYGGGVSAGGFNAVHAAYLDKDSELPEILREFALENGGIEGESGNPGYSSKIDAVVNLSGAIGDTAWMEVGDAPIVSVHGTADGTVPYGSDSITVLDINYPVDGSHSIHIKADQLGIRNALKPFPGQDHVPFVTNADYMDTTIWFTRDFMFEQVCPAFVGVKKLAAEKLSIYPNPSSNFIQFEAHNDDASYKILSVNGQTIRHSAIYGHNGIDISQLPTGQYMLEAKIQGNIARVMFTKP
jgi:hypothetical protein